VFWPFAAFTAQRRRTWLAVYAVPPMSTVIVTSARPTVSLVVPSTRRTTLGVGDRAFPVAAARAWNDLPPTIRASPSLLMFRQQLLKIPFLNNISLT